MSWTDWFIQEIKLEMREKMTSLDDVYDLMFLGRDKQELLDTAARIAKVSIQNRDNEIKRLEERLEDTLRRLRHVEQQLESQIMSNFMAPTIITDLTQTTIDQHKEIQRLKALLNPE